MTTEQNILAYLESRPELDIKPDGPGKYRLNSPLRPGSNSHAFILTVNPDGEHGAFNDFAREGEEKGSLYDLANRLNIPIVGAPTATAPASTKRTYAGLADYAAAHYAPAEAFTAAGWKGTTYLNRPALEFTTKTGPRYRFIDGKEPPYMHAKGYRRCWYGLQKAVKLAQDGQSLVLCNGEASTVTAQHWGLAAACVTSGEKGSIPDNLLDELKASFIGPVIVAFDCDAKGRAAGPQLAAQLQQAGYQAHAVNLGGSAGFDLADFCGLHKKQAVDRLQSLKEIAPKQEPKAPDTGIKSADYINALTTLGYSFRLNLLDDTVECNGHPITEVLAAEIKTRMRDSGFSKGISAMEDAYVTEAAKNAYHPIKIYLEGLTWDGYDYITDLTRHFTDEQEVFAKWFRKWIVGAVAKVYGRGQNPMLVLDGGQDKGKSTFAAWLCPTELKKHFKEGAIQPDKNDHQVLLATTWLWEVSELGATTRRADREALKSFITQQTVTARKPYDRRPIYKSAMTSFIGTINNEAGFLNDPTGNRRFLTCTITHIDFDYSLINVNDIWAQAYHLYKNGYDWQLSKEEKNIQRVINETYETEEPLIAEFHKHFETGTVQDWVSTSEILVKFGLDPLNRGNCMRLAQAMLKIPEVQKGKRGPETARINGYLGVKPLCTAS